MNQIVRQLIVFAVVVAVAGISICAFVFFSAERRITSIRAADSAEVPAKIDPAPLPPLPASTTPTVRVAIIGGMNETGFWQSIADRFTQSTGIKVLLLAAGPVDGIAPVFKHGGIDLITTHSCDTIMNLVADGYAIDPHPWAKNDLIIVGPPDDPAKIKGMTDVAAAFRKIIASKSTFIVHSSVGVHEVIEDILAPADLSLNPQTTISLLEDKMRRVLAIAAEKHAYTLIGRIPFLDGKIPNHGMVVMVQGDSRLRRPFVVEIANPERMQDVHFAEAKRLQEFLLSTETQRWIAQYDKGKYDDEPLFFPVWPTMK